MIAEVPALAPITAQHRAMIAGCARNEVYAAADVLLREGEHADAFYVIRQGAVPVDTHLPERGRVTPQSLHDASCSAGRG